jgi:hypothetical protein
VRAFFGSGHVDTQKIVEIFARQGSYYVPLHEFIRAVLFGDSEHYDPARSPPANVFDLTYADPKEHFLISCLVTFLGATSTSGAPSGFIDAARIYEHAQSLGFTPEQVDAAMAGAQRHKLIEAAARRQIGMEDQVPSAFRANCGNVPRDEALSTLYVRGWVLWIPRCSVTPYGNSRTRGDRRNSARAFHFIPGYVLLVDGKRFLRLTSISADIKATSRITPHSDTEGRRRKGEVG